MSWLLLVIFSIDIKFILRHSKIRYNQPSDTFNQGHIPGMYVASKRRVLQS